MYNIINEFSENVGYVDNDDVFVLYNMECGYVGDYDAFTKYLWHMELDLVEQR